MKKPVKFEEEIDIETYVTKISPVRINLTQNALVKGDLRVKADVELAVIDHVGKPKKMTDDLYQSFKSCI
jgi:acyl-CoA thioesterase FadM